MADVPVRTGYWVDHSYGSTLGSYLTLTVDQTNRLVAGTAVFITFVAGSIWSIYGFIAHQHLANKPPKDIVTHQHRSLFRNVDSPQTAITDALSLFLIWKNCGLYNRKGRVTRAISVTRRSIFVLVPALVIFAASILAGVFVANIASAENQQTRVVVQSTKDLDNCGITMFNNSALVLDAFDTKTAYDTRNAMSYSRSCYSTSTGSINSVACSLFVKPTLNYTMEPAECPFGEPTQDIGSTICGWNGNREAWRVMTAKLDSHHDFGINAASQDRLTLQKDTICSPLSQVGFVSSYRGYGSEINDSVISYNYGPVPAIHNATFLYNTASQYDYVPFQIMTVSNNATDLFPWWVPAPEIRRPDADVTIIFIAPNSMVYRRRVIDPVFIATYPTTSPSLTDKHNDTYGPDNKTSVMACTEQYQICAASNRCTPWTSFLPLQSNVTELNLNTAQSVTASRLLYAVTVANIFYSINGLGPEALRMYNGAYNLISPGVPQNQWQIEVEGWVQTNLARWQALMVEYAHNTADLGKSGHLDGPNNAADPFRQEWQRQCREQMRANLAGYQNVSVLGLGVVYGIGGLILLVGLILKPFVFMLDGAWPVNEDATNMSKSRTRRAAWNIDGKYQTQRVAFTTAGYADLEGGSGDVSYLKTRSRAPLPFQTDIVSSDTTFVARQPGQITGSTTSATPGKRHRWRRPGANKTPIVMTQAINLTPLPRPTQLASQTQPASQSQSATHTQPAAQTQAVSQTRPINQTQPTP